MHSPLSEMNVPLSVNPTVDNHKEKLKIWFNEKEEVIDAPIKPYYYAFEKLSNPARVSKIDKKALSDYQTKTFLKYEFKTRSELVKYRVKGKTFEDNIPFVLRNRLDNPDIYVDFPHTNKLKFLFLDIEQYIKPEKMSPMYNDRIISISWCGNDRKIKCAYLTKERKDDRKLLSFFIEDYKKINPDVLICYNKKYDVPTILQRCKQVNIDTTQFSKNNSKPYIGGKEAVNINGVVVYDVYLSAKADQSLNGNVANRGLKAVSNYFGFEEAIEPLDVKQTHKYVGTKELVKYNRDDVKRLLLLFDIYWSNIKFNANDLKIPLNTALELNTTDLGIVVMGDEYRKDGIIANGSNYYRYPEIFQVKREGGKYEGALVGIDQTGIFEPVYKADYSSMYPSIMSSFNLSPDVVTLVRYDRYSQFKIEEKDDYFIYHIPDKILNKTMVLKVLKKIGFMSELVSRFLQERSEYKKLWKQTGEKKYRAISDNRKVKANGGAYGNQGALNHPYGFAPIAVATCGIGRECAQLLIDVLLKLYKNSVIEKDTDGVYFIATNVDKEKIYELFEKSLLNKFKKELNLSIDIDEYDKGYFYKTKNYVLQRGKNLIFHGVAMKASSKNKISKSLINELAHATLNEETTGSIVREYRKLDFPLNDFAMSVTLGMNLREYKSKNAIASRMAIEAERKLDIKAVVGTQYHYIKTYNGYKLLDISKKSDIDGEYYLNQVNRIIKMFDAENVSNNLDKWL